MGLKGIFGQYDAVASAVVDAGEENDEGCAGADNDGVGEDAKSLEVWAMAAALGALPSPASLLKRPRLTPCVMAMPTAPPKAESMPKASRTMRASMEGMEVRLESMTKRAMMA